MHMIQECALWMSSTTRWEQITSLKREGMGESEESWKRLYGRSLPEAVQGGFPILALYDSRTDDRIHQETPFWPTSDIHRAAIVLIITSPRSTTRYPSKTSGSRTTNPSQNFLRTSGSRQYPVAPHSMTATHVALGMRASYRSTSGPSIHGTRRCTSATVQGTDSSCLQESGGVSNVVSHRDQRVGDVDLRTTNGPVWRVLCHLASLDPGRQHITGLHSAADSSIRPDETRSPAEPCISLRWRRCSTYTSVHCGRL